MATRRSIRDAHLRRGYEFDEFLADAAAVGWTTDLLLATWDLRPFTADADFLVALLHRV